MNAPEHPTYPLQLEQRAAIIMAPNDPETIRLIQLEFAKRRNAEFPGWRETYEAEVQAWIAWHQHPRKRA